MKTRKTQRGMTVVGFFLLLTVIGLVGLITVKMTPPYLEAYSVYQIFSGIQGERDLASKGSGEIRQAISRRFNINSIRDLPLNNLDITRTKDGYKVVLEYKREIHLFLNIDVVLSFAPEATVNRS